MQASGEPLLVPEVVFILSSFILGWNALATLQSLPSGASSLHNLLPKLPALPPTTHLLPTQLFTIFCYVPFPPSPFLHFHKVARASVLSSLHPIHLYRF